MPDLGHQLTEKELEKLEKKIAKEYKIAVKEMKDKLKDYKEKYSKQWYKTFEQFRNGEISQAEWDSWYKRHLNDDKHLKDMIDVLSQDMHQANVIAHKTATGGMADVYALNGNYATYMIEHGGRIDTGFTLYNHDSAAALLKEKKQLMPGPSSKKAAEIKANKDMQWNYNKIQSAVLQSVLQGESPYDLADRLEGIANMNRNASIRYARTMTTSVQNMGRYDAFERAKGLGVDLVAEWNAILDQRTRHDHRMLHGQRKPIGEPFVVDGFEILYPGQSDGPGASDIPQQLIWNCRCTIIAWVKGFEGKTVKENPDMGGLSFEEWQQEKAPKPKEEKQPAPAPEVKAPKAAPVKEYKTEVPNAEEFDDDYHTDMNFHNQPWDRITEAEENAIRDYTGADYHKMNELMRKGREEFLDKHPSFEGNVIARLEEKCKNAAAGLEKCTIKDDTQLYRGMGSKNTLQTALGIDEKTLEKMLKDGSIKGQTFIERGLCSTGINDEAGWDKQVLLDIHAPKGTRGLYVDPFSKNQGEQELLLAKNTVFGIYDYTVYPDAYGGKGAVKLFVDVIDQLPDWEL